MGFELRAWGLVSADAAALSAAWADLEVRRWTRVPELADVEAAARWIAGEPARRASGLALDLAMAEADGSAPACGEVGLVMADRSRRWAELGYWLAPSARGRGWAARSVDLLCGWALGRGVVRRVFAQVQPANPRSVRVLDRSAFTDAGELADGRRLFVRDGPGGPSGDRRA